ncbi:MAG: hypothetical protein K9I68_02435 [Bacteroidales bacterium]|nr:hypothetical protein [Bacteroidales bacterium]MCF8337171.1 hypothetical protein [Bacteroidales bacterium]
MEIKTHFIGINGETTVNSEQTRQQINLVKKLKCSLVYENQELTWGLFDDPEEPRSIFQAIEHDRRRRVDKKTFMADRPSFAVVTSINDIAHRLEFYEGHDALSLIFDIRSKQFQNLELSHFLAYDPNGYDPVEFLKNLGYDSEFAAKIIKTIHNEID